MIACTFENGDKASLRHITVGVILLNKERDKILLVRRANLPDYLEPNKLGLPGGYMSRDENTKDTAVRESKEETGYIIEVEKLFRINDNPNRPKEDRQNVEFVYIGKAIQEVSGFDKEIQSIQWYSLDDLPPANEFAFDHYENLQLYIKYVKEKFQLPIF